MRRDWKKDMAAAAGGVGLAVAARPDGFAVVSGDKAVSPKSN
jgi:hypothetical protein